LTVGETKPPCLDQTQQNFFIFRLFQKNLDERKITKLRRISSQIAGLEEITMGDEYANISNYLLSKDQLVDKFGWEEYLIFSLMLGVRKI
jgi:hypothetical protein